ncbi:RimK family protein [Rhodoferax sp. 4810]|uniref:RimK family protein n=1 Tax=Thiospirillum jenense TaxID=1653858 RepID=A0A839HCH1_9GAMM|nr:RimK family protein [Thiospirillum jenense]MBB1076555.1 RimK family protein [Rhodoferax jenense]MBB1124739.1 RimK family protein [Thiospirillum jenense]
MAEHLLLVEQESDWKSGFPRLPVVTARDYLGRTDDAKLDGNKRIDCSSRRDLRVINLCRSYRYLSIGYYCSLLAEARDHKVVPSVRTIQELSSREIYGLVTDELNQRVQRLLGARKGGPTPTAYELTLMFGHCASRELQPLARQIFETFRCPILRVELRLQGSWRIADIKALPLSALSSEQEADFFTALEWYLSQRWRQPRARLRYRYDLAVLHDPVEDLPPSNPRALRQFIRAGKDLDVNVELIQRKDYGRLAEYDALLIRETTRLGHHTFRFAKKADSEGMVVIDDPDSILRCTNKVFLAELLEANRVPRPRTLILRKETLFDAESEIGYPVVLKIPEGSFSRGVFKAENRPALTRIARRLLRESDLILAQEYLYTEFDWRIGILGRRPLFASKYFMSKAHWQVVRHREDGKREEGSFETVPIEAAPPEVVRVALKAANLIGDGLYGVDVKMTTQGAVVIEVNDNPNIDAGIEDLVLGEALYRNIIGELLTRLEKQRGPGGAS